MWIDDEFHVDDVWMGMVRSLMDAEAFQADLSTEAAADSMNRWIAAKTNGMIDQMLEDPLDRWTRLVIFDTVYFKGRWEKPFEAQNTHREDFCVDKAQGITEQVDMMNQYWSSLDYISNDFAEGVILPYQNNPEEGFELTSEYSVSGCQNGADRPETKIRRRYQGCVRQDDNGSHGKYAVEQAK